MADRVKSSDFCMNSAGLPPLSVASMVIMKIMYPEYGYMVIAYHSMVIMIMIALSQMPVFSGTQKNNIHGTTPLFTPRDLWTLGNSFWPGMASWAMAL